MSLCMVLVLPLLLLLCSGGFCQHHGEHKHYWPGEGQEGNILHKGIIMDWDHLKEDANERFHLVLDDDLSDAEKEFYYFQLHDMNDDGKLDGLEILAAMNHVTDTPIEDKADNQEDGDIVDYVMRLRKQKRWNAKFLLDSRIIDEIFKEDDVNFDGYLSYLEFISSRRAKINIS